MGPNSCVLPGRVQEDLERTPDLPAGSVGRHKLGAAGPRERYSGEEAWNSLCRKETSLGENPEENAQRKGVEDSPIEVDRHQQGGRSQPPTTEVEW